MVGGCGGVVVVGNRPCVGADWRLVVVVEGLLLELLECWVDRV